MNKSFDCFLNSSCGKMWCELHGRKQRPQMSSYIEGENEIKMYILWSPYIKQ